MKTKIGFFDSGMGGTTIFNAVKNLLPDEEYFYLADSKNCPYGEKSDDELKKIVTKNTETLINWGAKIIVIACNTATVKCIEYLREKYPDIKFVGTEPAIKLAADTDAKDILVLATPGTVQSERTHMLLNKNQKPGQKINLLACPGLADTIENTLKFDENYQLITPNSDEKLIIAHKLSELFAEIIETPNIIVLGCTHYSLIKPEIQNFFPNTTLIDGSEGIAHQVENALKTDYNVVNE